MDILIFVFNMAVYGLAILGAFTLATALNLYRREPHSVADIDRAIANLRAIRVKAVQHER